MRILHQLILAVCMTAQAAYAQDGKSKTQTKGEAPPAPAPTPAAPPATPAPVPAAVDPDDLDDDKDEPAAVEEGDDGDDDNYDWGDDNDPNIDTVSDRITDGGGYGGFVIHNGKLGDTAATHLGFRGAWVFQSSTAVGFVANRLASDRSAPSPYKHLELDIGYSGILVEYIWRPRSLVHGTFSLAFGNGEVRYQDVGRDYSKVVKKDFFQFVEPEAAVEVNLHDFIRLALGVSLLAVRDLEIQGLRANDIENASATLTLKFGKF